MIRASRSLCALVGILGFVSGCEEKKPSAAPTAKEGGAAPSDQALDPSVVKAVAAAASAKPGRGRGQGAEGGPPPNGVFDPGMADKELAPGAPPKITVGSTGKEPRFPISLAPKAGSKIPAHLSLQLRTGPRSALPTIDFILSFEVEKPKGAAPGAVPAAAAPAAAAPTDLGVTVKVTKAALGTTQPGNVPAEVGKLIGQLGGSTVTYRVAPNGAGSDFKHTISNAAANDLDEALRAVEEAIATTTIPAPVEALGAEAFWMVTTRERFLGSDVIAYRMIKVESNDGKQASLDVSVKRYAANASLTLPGAPGQLSIEQFMAVSEGQVDVLATGGFPGEHVLTQQVQALMTVKEKPDQKASLQTEAKTLLEMGGKKKPAGG